MHCTVARRRAAVRKRPQAKVTILVIEDERFVRDVTCEILRQAGYRVLGAECAAAARRVFDRHGKRIHLLLCDAVLPDSGGARLSQTLRRLSPDLKVILASGYPKSALPAEFCAESEDEFLSKPYCAAALIGKVQTALQSLPLRSYMRGM